MQKIGELIPQAISRIQSPAALTRSRLVDEWPSVAGARIAPHTKPSLSQKGDLYVWVDQATLAFELNQRYRLSILKRVQALLGEDVVKSVHFRVGQLR